jgi:hypothetical protein
VLKATIENSTISTTTHKETMSKCNFFMIHLLTTKAKRVNAAFQNTHDPNDSVIDSVLTTAITKAKVIRDTVTRAIRVRAVAARSVLQLLLKLGSCLKRVSAAQTGGDSRRRQHHSRIRGH